MDIFFKLIFQVLTFSYILPRYLFSIFPHVSSTNKTDRYDIAEIEEWQKTSRTEEKGQKEKQRSTKRYTEKKISSNTNPTKNGCELGCF